MVVDDSDMNITDVKNFIRESFNRNPGFQLEYVEIANAETLEPVTRKNDKMNYMVFVAAYLRGVRLIDNIALTNVTLPHANTSS